MIFMLSLNKGLLLNAKDENIPHGSSGLACVLSQSLLEPICQQQRQTHICALTWNTTVKPDPGILKEAAS